MDGAIIVDINLDAPINDKINNIGFDEGEWYWDGIFEFEEFNWDGTMDYNCINCGIILINDKEDYYRYEPSPGHIKGDLKINKDRLRELKEIRQEDESDRGD
jgi:hypothetical protein